MAILQIEKNQKYLEINNGVLYKSLSNNVLASNPSLKNAYTDALSKNPTNLGLFLNSLGNETDQTGITDFIRSVGNLSSLVCFLAPQTGWVFAIMDAKIDVTYSNTIVQTVLVGRKGSVKEYICGRDYDVVISGTLIGGVKNMPPLGLLPFFRQCMESQDSLIVASPYLATYNIFKVALQNYKMTQSGDKQFTNAQKCVLTFVSDKDVDLDILPDPPLPI